MFRRTAVIFSIALAACGAKTRTASGDDIAKAQAACTTRGGSPTLSATIKADLDRGCAAKPAECTRFQGSVAGICAHQDKVAKIPLSTRVDVFATIGANDEPTFDDLCHALRGTSIGFLQDIDIWVPRGGEEPWGKKWQRRCGQGTGAHFPPTP